MCVTGMESVDEDRTLVVHNHATDASLAGLVSSSSSTGGGRKHSFSSSECSVMLGPGTAQAYGDLPLGCKPNNMATDTLNPFQEQGAQSFAPSSMLPKNGTSRQGLWSTSGAQRNFMNEGRNNRELEMDPRIPAPDYSSALLDQFRPAPIPEPYRVSGGLARYHSAPSSFLAGLADFHQDSALSSFFSEADLPPLNAASDSSLENMDTEQSTTSLYDDKFLLTTRKFERIGSPQLGTGGGGLVSQKSMQSLYKPSMEVLLENSSGPSPQIPLGSQISSTTQMQSNMGISSSLGMSSSMGLPQQQEGNTQAGQKINLENLSGNMNFSCGIGSDFGGSGSSVTRGGLPSSNGPSSLLRQSSSPAGLLARLSIDVQQAQLAKNNERQSGSSPQSPEDSLSGGTSEENAGTPRMVSSMDVGGWEDAANSYMNTWGNDTFAARKRYRDNMDLGDIIVPSDASVKTSLEHGPPPGSLMRHMSLPTPKSKSGLLPEDILQSVPCRIRAKRGCATHPRSIAERVRRTRISERMRKLQELVPNMDKQQTNTADMLDEAVEYVKELQRKVQELTESQAKCKCKGLCNQEHKNSLS